MGPESKPARNPRAIIAARRQRRCPRHQGGARRFLIQRSCPRVALRARRRPSLHACPSRFGTQHVHLVHRADVDGGDCARRGGAHRRAVGDERIPGGAAQPDPLRRVAHRDPRASRARRRRRSRPAGAHQPARQGGRAVCAGAGDALRRRGEPRCADPRHRPGTRGHRCRHRVAHARGIAFRSRARRIRHRSRRRARARARRAHGRHGRGDHAAGHRHTGRDAPSPQELPCRRRVRNRHVRVRQRVGARSTSTMRRSSTGSPAFPECA